MPNQYIYDLVDVWNNSLTTFTAIKMNVQDNASASGSLLMDLQVGGDSRVAAIGTNTTFGGAVRIRRPNTTGGVLLVEENLNSGTLGVRNATTGNLASIKSIAWEEGTQSAVILSNTGILTGGSRYLGFGATNASSTIDLFLTRRAAASLRLGAADVTEATATITADSTTDLITWSNHGLMTGSAIRFTNSGGALPGGISAATTYYVVVNNTTTFKIATTYDNALAATPVTVDITSNGTGTNTATAGQTQQSLSVQGFTGTDAIGSPFVINGSQGTGTGVGGDIIFRVAPAGGSSGSAQNALATALTIASTGTVSIGGLTLNPTNGAVTIGQTAQILMQTSNAFIVRHGNSDAFNIRPVSSGSPTLSLLDTTNATMATLIGEAANTLALRNGANPQTFRVYNTTDGTNLERGFMRWSSNVLQIGTEKAGTGTARALDFQTDGVTRMTLSATSAGITFPANNGNISLGTSGVIITRYINNGNNTLSMFDFVADATGTATFAVGGSAPLLRFGGTNNTFPALKRSSTTLQARLADDSAFASVQGKITTETAYTAGDPTTTGYLVIYDSNGTAYKVPAVAL